MPTASLASLEGSPLHQCRCSTTLNYTPSLSSLDNQEDAVDKHVNSSLFNRAGLTIRHGTHVRRAPGWKEAPDQAPKNDMRPKF